MTETIDRPGVADPEEWVAAPADLPVRVLGAVTEAVANLDDTLWSAKPPRVLLAAMRSPERLRSTLDALELQVVAEIDATQGARHEG